MHKGDRVRRIKCDNGERVPIGSVGTVIKSRGDIGSLVKWDHLDLCDGADDHGYSSDCYLELIGDDVLPYSYVSDLCRGTSPITKPSNPKDRAATHRLDLTLFPETARIFGAVAMTEGDSKYGGYNYRAAGVCVSTYVAALGRHIGKYYDRGEWADEKTGVPHLANALACIAVLIDGHVANNLTDDRPPKVQGDLYVWAESLSKKLHEMFPQGPPRETQIHQGAIDANIPDWLSPKPSSTNCSK